MKTMVGMGFAALLAGGLAWPVAGIAAPPGKPEGLMVDLMRTPERALITRPRLMGILGVRARDLAGFSVLQLVVHVPLVFLLCWALSYTF